MTILARSGALLLALAALAGPALADGAVTVTGAWVRAGTPAAKTGAAFLTVTNGTGAPDRLIAAQTPIADKAELHTHMMDDGIMKMRGVDALDVAPGAPVALKPGGLHVMLLGLKQPLTEGSRFPITLTFDKAGSITVDVTVQGAAAMGPAP